MVMIIIIMIIIILSSSVLVSACLVDVLASAFMCLVVAVVVFLFAGGVDVEVDGVAAEVVVLLCWLRFYVGVCCFCFLLCWLLVLLLMLLFVGGVAVLCY